MGQVPQPKAVYPLVLAATAVLVVWIAWGSFHDPEAMWAPGDLSRSHIKVASCMQCHESFHGPTVAKCLACHTEDRFTQASTIEVKQRHITYIRRGQTCSLCHIVHRGR